MLESSRRTSKNKTSLININSQNSYKDLIKKNKKMTKRNSKKKNKTINILKTFENIEVKEEKKQNFH